MPLNTYDALTTATHLSQLEPDLAYLFDELQISEQVQANISEREIRKLGVFAKVEPSEDSFREWLKADLGLDPQHSVGERVLVAKLSEAWEAARQRASTTRKMDAEARVSGQARELLKGTHLALRRACARAHGPVEDRRCPGRAYLEMRLEQLDDGELEAEPLSKVTTVALEQESVATQPGAGVDVRKDGVLHVIKGKRTAPLPTGPEQFRAVMRVMALHWEMVHLKGAGRAVLKDYSTAVFEKHVEYILGDECLLIGEANPTMSCTPSWELLMKYELEIRKLAVRKVNEGGTTLAEGMAFARTSVEHRTSYFITPLAMPGARASAPRSAGTWESLRAQDARGSKRSADEALSHPDGGSGSSGAPPGSGKGKGKGKGKDKKQKYTGTQEELKKLSPRGAYKLIRNAPGRYGVKFRGADGAPRCHAFQAGACQSAGCKFVHTCVRCGGAHGVTRCPEMGLEKE